MKKICSLMFLVLVGIVHAQTFPVNNLTVAGTSSFTGQSTFTVSPTAPTPVGGDSTTKLATTAFVASGFAGLSSPGFTGIPTAPTAAVGVNSIQLATTA